MVPPVRPLQLPPPYPQFTSNSSEIRSNMTKKLDATGVNWMNSGIVKQANIDYTERVWEEFVQSIHTFIEDKRNLSQHTPGKKRVILIVIPSIRFTKLIIHHLQRRHKFHPRPDSPLQLPNEEPVLGYLKFSAKGTKREVFRMPIPGSLIIAEIQEAPYYREYLIKEKKRKQATETSNKPPKAKKSKYGLLSKKHTLKNVAASKAEDVPAMEPQVVLGADEGGQDKGQDGPDPGTQAEDQTGSDASAHDEGQAGSNPDETSEGQVGPDPGDAGAKVQSIPSHVVHAGLDHEHMDLDVADVSPQPSTEQLDEGFTATVYLKVQENLKLAVEE
nr:hypothetical protein [Tanacetum cinerariifolium]